MRSTGQPLSPLNTGFFAFRRKHEDGQKAAVYCRSKCAGFWKEISNYAHKLREVFLMHYYTREVKDYSAQTMHLSLLEHGVYVRLIDVYLVNEAPISEATKYRICGAKTAAEKSAVDNILSEFFFLSDSFWRHPWCDKAIAKYRNRSAANKSNGEKGGRPKVVNFHKTGEQK